MNEFDFEGVFNEDYLYFYEGILNAERTKEDVEKILELLELAAGASVLDCPCGRGRIANSLAERGFRVTGIDASEFFLERARADAAERGVEVEYVEGDMRQLPWREEFDALVNWFTSFGYFSDDQNKAVLEQFHDVLKPGGKLILETQNITRILVGRPHRRGVIVGKMRSRPSRSMRRARTAFAESYSSSHKLPLRSNTPPEGDQGSPDLAMTFVSPSARTRSTSRSRATAT